MLDRINSPEDLKRLSREELPPLAGEIREFLLKTLTRTGGHLALNLGVVELTLALHYIFDSPRDRLLWDVSHQAYTHKILTGRREQFPTLRQLDGLSGFTRRSESEHDAFDAGHGGTSISAALGMARARALTHTPGRVIAIIGDGSLTSGMALEALNDAGHANTNLLVVLNDNAMAISQNVGAIAGYLYKARSDPGYLKAREAFNTLMKRLPGGFTVVGLVERLKAAVKQVFIPGMLFEDLGFTYLGPVDGHNIPALLNALERVKRLEGPVLLHVLTTKGKGYSPAEAHDTRLHGIGAFDIETGEPLGDLQSCQTLDPRPQTLDPSPQSPVPTPQSPVPSPQSLVPTPSSVSYSRAFGEAMCRLAEEHKEVVAITAAMCDGTGLNDFRARYPERFFDVGMAEEHAVTLAAGMAVEGLRPVVAVYSTFLQRAFDQLVHDVCLPGLPVVFALDRAGLVGDDGPTHHGVLDLSYLGMMPGMTVMAPSSQRELGYMLEAALRMSGPCAIRYPRGNPASVGQAFLPVQVDDPAVDIANGKAAILRGRPASSQADVALVGIGTMVSTVLEAADLLAQREIQATVVDARFARPLDRATLLAVAGQVPALVTVEENAVIGGFGAAVRGLLAEAGYSTAVATLGIPDLFVGQGPREILLARLGLSPAAVAETAAALVAHPGAVTRRNVSLPAASFPTRSGRPI